MEWMQWTQTIGAIAALSCLMKILMTLKVMLRHSNRKQHQQEELPLV